jgi:hypothetical protein
MQSPIVQAQFDGTTRDGREIAIEVRIGDAHDHPTDCGDVDKGFYIEVEPLMERRRQIGTDSLSAMCFGIELVRKSLKIFVAHGGFVYFRGTRSPIDLDSYWFESIGGLLREEFVKPNPTLPSAEGDSAK